MPPRLRLPGAAPRPAGVPPRRALHLHVVHLPSQWPTYTPYALATELQASLAAPHHAYKAAPIGEPPAPAVLSFTPAPTYTLGRRQKVGADIEGLLAPLRVRKAVWRDGAGDEDRVGVEGGGEEGGGEEGEETTFTPVVTHSPRGGLTTYHGPGQLVLWPTLDLRSPLHPPLTVRSYARLLEDTTISLLARYNIAGARDEENPGVWVGDRKIAAMGIHLRRHVATLGVAVNLTVPVGGGEGVNPWARFVPCGIEGRGVTSVVEEGGGRLEGGVVAKEWVGEFKRRLERGG